MAIDLPIDEIVAYCEKHLSIRKLSLFGSVLRDDFGPDSDIDILVEFYPEANISLFDMGAMQQDFEELLGREVDFLTKGFLSEYFRDKVVANALTIYERK
jgi:predicted nucleotidyltransferase